LRDIDTIIWNNLDRIGSNIEKDIDSTVLTKQYDWVAGRTNEEIQQLSDAERKRLYYLAARRAGEHAYEQLAKHIPMAREALSFWQEYWRRAVVSRGLSEERIENAFN